MITLKLKKKEERRVLRGHPWIFSNELQEVPAGIAPGSMVEVRDSAGGFVGRGTCNPRTLIAVRILTRQPREEVDAAFLRTRIEQARDLRRRLGFGEHCRVVFGESDGLPGLVVDRYGDVLVAQVLTAGMELLRESVLDGLEQAYSPRAIVLRNDSSPRELEGLPLEKTVARGALPDAVIAEESGIRYRVDVLEGQKTGFFFDQRENRLALAGLVKGLRVLDCFSYVGAWALTAAKGGASEVTGIDSSERAVALAQENAGLNGLDAKFVKADVFDLLRDLEKRKERYGCIILDPPAFVKNRAKVREALKGYKEINLRAMKLLEPGGILATCSCSHHIDEALFREMLGDAAYSAGRTLRLLEMRSQARDHPVLLAARETQYLKCAIMSVD